jgi:hypothetical protein
MNKKNPVSTLPGYFRFPRGDRLLKEANRSACLDRTYKYTQVESSKGADVKD